MAGKNRTMEVKNAKVKKEDAKNSKIVKGRASIVSYMYDWDKPMSVLRGLPRYKGWSDRQIRDFLGIAQ